jgi:superfamily I DNA and/or RNA helicase
MSWSARRDSRGEKHRNVSAEEVECIAGLVDDLVDTGVNWIDEGRSRPPVLYNVLIVVPYNAQVSDLSKRIPNARVGTVAKFQGQQAPVVIYSMTTFSPEDGPRGMDFFTA